jgi:hypothetical protein
MNQNATMQPDRALEVAVRSIVQDLDPVSREIGVPPTYLLNRLREKWGYAPGPASAKRFGPGYPYPTRGELRRERR